MAGMGRDFGSPLPEGLQTPTFIMWRAAAELRAEVESELREQRGCELRYLAGLAVISEKRGMYQAEIAEKLGVDRTSVADLLADYMAEGLVVRDAPGESGRHDLRRASVSVTADGEAALADLLAVQKAAERRFLERLECHEIRELGRLMRKLEPPDRSGVFVWVRKRVRQAPA
jgi:DNA-binding MarR family transcriptional regulator